MTSCHHNSLQKTKTSESDGAAPQAQLRLLVTVRWTLRATPPDRIPSPHRTCLDPDSRYLDSVTETRPRPMEVVDDHSKIGRNAALAPLEESTFRGVSDCTTFFVPHKDQPVRRCRSSRWQCENSVRDGTYMFLDLATYGHSFTLF